MRKLTVLTLLLVLGLSVTAFAAVPRLINYQGRLTDAGDTPLEGSFDITFRIYDAQSGGNLLWEETQSVLIQKGVFSVLLGGTKDLDLAFDKPYWLAIKVGADSEMSPRQQIASSGYAMRADTADKLGEAQESDFVRVDQEAGGNLSGVFSNLAIADNSISKYKLKTAVGEVSASNWEKCLLPGGEYGFYPQVRVNAGSGGVVAMGTEHVGDGGWYALFSNTTYGSYIVLAISGGSSGTSTSYARQRYITASGIDLWIFIKANKASGDVLASWQSSDAPAYGNGGDFDKVPHPFGERDESVEEIILVDKTTSVQLAKKAQALAKSILTLINEDYAPDMAKEEVYQPLHSGKFLNGEPVMVEGIPSYIKVRKLRVLSSQEKQARDQRRQEAIELRDKEVRPQH